MITVTIYNDNIRLTSTRRPTSGQSYSVSIKDATSVLRPTFLLRADLGTVSDATYIAAPIFDRIYRVLDIRSVFNGGVEIDCAVDVLKTYRDKIRAATWFITRSQSASNITACKDPLFIPSLQSTASHQILDLPEYTGTWCYVLQVVTSLAGDDSSTGGGTTLYAVAPTSMQKLVTNLFTTSLYGDELKDDTVKTFFNPFQYVISCQYFPFPRDWFSTKSDGQYLSFGWWTTAKLGLTEGAVGKVIDLYGKRLTTPVIQVGGNYTDFTDRSPDWVDYTLYYPGFPIIQLPAEIGGQNIVITVDLDFLTGSGFLQVHAGSADGPIITTQTGQLGTSVQLAQLSADLTRVWGGEMTQGSALTKGLLSAVQSLATGDIPGVIGSAIDAGSSYTKSRWDVQKAEQSPALSLAGSAGNRYAIFNNSKIILTKRKHNVYTDPHTARGYVCNQRHTLSELSGYTEVLNGLENSVAATAAEQSELARTMEGGFWNE